MSDVLELQIRDFVIGFDLDMTLVDSSEGIVDALQAAFNDQGIRANADDIVPLIGLPLEALIRNIAPNVDVQRAAACYREFYAHLAVPATRLLDGALEALTAVHEANGGILILSAKFEQGVQLTVSHVGIGSLLSAGDQVIGGVFGAEKTRILRAANALAYVGDLSTDVAAARSAGSVPIAVATGAHNVTSLWKAGAYYVLKSLREFPNILDDLLRK